MKVRGTGEGWSAADDPAEEILPTYLYRHSAVGAPRFMIASGSLLDRHCGHRPVGSVRRGHLMFDFDEIHPILSSRTSATGRDRCLVPLGALRAGASDQA